MQRQFLMLTATIFFVSFLNAQTMEKKNPNITASYEILIDAPIDKVWKALAIDFDNIGNWASGVNHVVESKGEGLSAERSCEINAKGFNDTKERIIRFEPEKYYFEYDLYEGLPGFVKYSINQYQLKEQDGKTLYKATNVMRVGGIMGATMKGFMKKNLKNVLANMGQEIKYYIETGKQHPNKLAAIAKKEGKELFVIEQNIDASAEKVWQVIAHDFDKVSNSHPISSKSKFVNGNSSVQVGSQRIMYMSDNEKKYFVDEIVRLDEIKRNMLINVVKAKGYPIKFSNVEFFIDELEKSQSKLTMVFSYQIKPKFLQGMAKKSLKKQLQAYVYAIDHHSETNEIITKKNWKSISKKYSLASND